MLLRCTVTGRRLHAALRVKARRRRPALTHLPHGGAGQLQRVDAAHDGHGLGVQQGTVGAGVQVVVVVVAAAGGRGAGRQLLGGQQEAEAEGGGGAWRPAALRQAAQLAAVAALQVPPALLQVLHVAGAGGHRVHLVPDQLPHLPLLARGGAARPRREQQPLVLQHLLDQHLRLRLVEVGLAPLGRVLGHRPPPGAGAARGGRRCPFPRPGPRAPPPLGRAPRPAGEGNTAHERKGRARPAQAPRAPRVDMGRGPGPGPGPRPLRPRPPPSRRDSPPPARPARPRRGLCACSAAAAAAPGNGGGFGAAAERGGGGRRRGAVAAARAGTAPA